MVSIPSAPSGLGTPTVLVLNRPHTLWWQTGVSSLGAVRRGRRHGSSSPSPPRVPSGRLLRGPLGHAENRPKLKSFSKEFYIFTVTLDFSFERDWMIHDKDKNGLFALINIAQMTSEITSNLLLGAVKCSESLFLMSPAAI